MSEVLTEVVIKFKAGDAIFFLTAFEDPFDLSSMCHFFFFY